jgi:branched-chain amino acid aminotransferase
MSAMISKPTTSTAPSAPAQAADKPLIWVNGQMLPKSQAMVSVYDHGLLYGDGVFEGIRVYNGKIFKCEQHIRRLYECAKRIHLDLDQHVSREEMVHDINKLRELGGEMTGLVNKWNEKK